MEFWSEVQKDEWQTENVQKNAQFVSEASDNIRSAAVEVSAKAEDVKKNADIVSEAKGSIRLMETSVKEQAGLVNQAVKESLEGAKKAEQFAHEAELHKKDIDAAIEDADVDKNLNKAIKQSDGSLLNPFQQAKYITELPLFAASSLGCYM